MPTIRDEDIVLHRFYEIVRAQPDAIQMTQPLGGGRVDDFSFARVLDEARRMAGYLRSLGLPPQSHVALVSKNCAHFVIADLAIWMAGHVSVPLYPTLNAETVRYVLGHSESKLLFVGKLDAFGEIEKGIPSGMPCVALPLAPRTPYPAWNDLVRAHAPIPDEPHRSPDDPATIIYTSGSTGQQKGVVHSFATLSAPTHGIVKLLGVGRGDRYLSYLPVAHGMDRWLSECVSLVTGMRLYFAESVDTFVEDLRRARPTLFLSVPRLWLKFQLGVFAKMPEAKLRRLLKIPVISGIVKRKVLSGLGLECVRFAGSGSAPIPPDLIRWYRDLGLELLEGYGMTENFNYSHVNRPGKARPGFVGNPYEGVECRIGDGGEVLVKSPGVMVGYYKEPELTKECFTDDGFLRTGDQGEIDAEGRLRITGRVKELFKTSKGKYVAPAPIENTINADGRIELSCVAGAGQPATHAVVQLAEQLHAKRADPAVRAEVTTALEALVDRVNREVQVYEQLAFIAVCKDRWTVEGGLLTPTMKLRRAAIESRYAPELAAWYRSGRRVVWQD